MQSLLDDKAEQLTAKLIEMALGGDVTALRLCADRILPARKDRPIELNLPPTETVKQTADAMGTVCTAIAEGQITPSEGEALSNVLLAQQAIRVKADLESRMEEIAYRLSLGRMVSESGELMPTSEKLMPNPTGTLMTSSQASTFLWESTAEVQQAIESGKSNKPPEKLVEKELLKDYFITGAGKLPSIVPRR
jgi:hypothetical protein